MYYYLLSGENNHESTFKVKCIEKIADLVYISLLLFWLKYLTNILNHCLMNFLCLCIFNFYIYACIYVVLLLLFLFHCFKYSEILIKMSYIWSPPPPFSVYNSFNYPAFDIQFIRISRNIIFMNVKGLLHLNLISIQTPFTSV